MSETTWKWASLDDKALELVQEAEATIGADSVRVYAEGGPRTDEDARVLDVRGEVIPGLYAAGEAVGGVHGAVSGAGVLPGEFPTA